METYAVNVKRVPKLSNIGDNFFVIKDWVAATYKTQCPICDDKKKIMYRGHEFSCPNCTNIGKNENQIIISVRSFCICEFIVYNVEIVGSEYKKDYRPKNLNDISSLPRIRCKRAFCKTGNGYYSESTMIVPSEAFIDPVPEKILSLSFDLPSAGFTTKRRAQEALKLLVDREKERLAAFNKKYGCNYEYPEEL